MKATEIQKIFVCASFMLASIVGFSEVKQSFESGNFADLDGTQGGGKWQGDGVIVDGQQASLPASRPIVGDNQKVLSVAGEVVCSNLIESSTSNVAETDFLIKVEGPNDGLLTEGLADAQIAVAAGITFDEANKTVPVLVYCIPRGGEQAQWVNVASVATGSWVRVTMSTHYDAGYCRISIDGLPVVSDFGCLSTNITDKAGAWYCLANNPSQKKLIKELKFVGLAQLDDVVITESITSAKFGDVKTSVTIAEGVTEDVSLDDLTKWGVTPQTVATTCIDGSGLTVAQKLECGLRPDDGKSFKLSKMQMVSAKTANIKFPGSEAALSRYSIVATGADGQNVDISVVPNSASIADGEVSMNVIIPDNAPDVVFIKVKAQASAVQVQQ